MLVDVMAEETTEDVVAMAMAKVVVVVVAQLLLVYRYQSN